MKYKILISTLITLCLIGSVSAYFEINSYCENDVRFYNIECGENLGNLICTYDKETCELGCDGDICMVCQDTEWTPSTDDTCIGIELTQTSNCGNTRQIQGTKQSQCQNPSEVQCGIALTSQNECEGCQGTGAYCSEGQCIDNECKVIENNIVEPTKDTKVARSMPTSNFGTGRYMMVNQKSIGTDRSYIGFDLSNYNFNTVKLQIPVYYTGSEVVNQKVQAWVCNGIDFDESTLTWNTQPFGWNKNGNLVTYNKVCYGSGAGAYCIYKEVSSNLCILADEYTITNKVIAGIPETWHNWDLSGYIAELKQGTIVLKYPTETWNSNSRYVQYLTTEYPEAEYRPQFILS